jgi:ABC-type polysaccharide/polyol phosphate export permease
MSVLTQSNTILSAFIITLLYRAISSRYAETKTGIRYISISFFIVSVICYLVLSLQGRSGTDYQTSLALFVSSSLLGVEWWVQATINSAASKSHTVNTVMNHRYSKFFSSGVTIFLTRFQSGKSLTWLSLSVLLLGIKLVIRA